MSKELTDKEIQETWERVLEGYDKEVLSKHIEEKGEEAFKEEMVEALMVTFKKYKL